MGEDEDGAELSSPTDSDNETPTGNASRSFFSRRKKQRANGYGTVSSQRSSKSTRLTDLILPPVDTGHATPSTSSRLLITTLSLSASVILSVLIFTLVGLTSVLTSRERIGVVNWVVIGVVFGAVCL